MQIAYYVVMENHNEHKTVEQFVKDVGRDKILSLGFCSQDVSRAIKENLFPSGWQIHLRNLAAPDHLFRWATPHKTGDKQ